MPCISLQHNILVTWNMKMRYCYAFFFFSFNSLDAFYWINSLLKYDFSNRIFVRTNFQVLCHCVCCSGAALFCSHKFYNEITPIVTPTRTNHSHVEFPIFSCFFCCESIPFIFICVDFSHFLTPNLTRDVELFILWNKGKKIFHYCFSVGFNEHLKFDWNQLLSSQLRQMKTKN